jgi:RimJ/RimL family protein N-acetyltransferase
MTAYVRSALADRERGLALPFVTCLKPDGKVIGSTRFGNIDTANRKAEIGWTWIAPRWQRTAVNTEAKMLMLTHAFEVWNCIRVEFKTDALNERSRDAILRIGARQEGILRNHMVTDSGRFRDSVYFSIIESEWPAVKSALQNKLRSYR